MTKTIKGFIKTFNKHELGKEYTKTNSYLADGILFELKDVTMLVQMTLLSIHIFMK